MEKVKLYSLPIESLYPECKISVKQKKKKRWVAQPTISFIEGETEIAVLKNTADQFRNLALLIEEMIEEKNV